MPAPSFSFRPAKHVQRLMIVDACRRLRAIAPLREYRYVGLGGFEFVDFELVRRTLGIEQMLSYENAGEPDRYNFNRPFGGIDIKFGDASEYLPELDRARLHIVWLDYCDRLNTSVLQDLETAAYRLISGSLLIVSVNAVPARPATARREQLAEDLGEARIPPGVTDATLAKWGLAALQRRIATDAINEALGRRGDGAEFRQIFNFHYADTSQMFTLGGVIVAPGTTEAFNATRLTELQHVKTGAEAYRINVPVLTAREALHINTQLPTADPLALEAPGLSDDEKRAYAELYRWYPEVPVPLPL